MGKRMLVDDSVSEIDHQKCEARHSVSSGKTVFNMVSVDCPPTGQLQTQYHLDYTNFHTDADHGSPCRPSNSCHDNAALDVSCRTCSASVFSEADNSSFKGGNCLRLPASVSDEVSGVDAILGCEPSPHHQVC